jgi:hypothetical protein
VGGDRPCGSRHRLVSIAPLRQSYPALSWFAQFDDPIELPDGPKLLTLRDAAEYLTKSSEGRARNTRVADSYGSADPGRRERRPDDVAADRLLKALNRHLVRQFDPDRKGARGSRDQ